jgi:MFS family permease
VSCIHSFTLTSDRYILANHMAPDLTYVSQGRSLIYLFPTNRLGFSCGPILWAPISEIWGRRISMLPPMFCLGLLSIGTATSKNAQSIFITRFFGGVFGSAPVANVSAALGDMWSPKARGTAVVFYAVAVVGGPTLGPVIGSALLVNPHLGWRWTEYIEAIWVFAIAAIGVFAFPEMYAPVLLKWRAQRLRKETGNQALYHPHERMKLDLKSIVTKQFSRPLLMLFTEPMVTAIAVYASFVYGLLFLTLEVFPIVFEEHRHWSPVVGSLPFLGLFVGVLSAIAVNLANQPRYRRISDAAGGRPVPEARLAPMAVGGIIFATGLFWFGWTAGNNIHCKFSTYVGFFVFLVLMSSRDCTCPRNGLHRCRIQHHLPAMHQLPRRHVCCLRRICSICKHHSPKFHGRRLPIIC